MAKNTFVAEVTFKREKTTRYFFDLKEVQNISTLRSISNESIKLELHIRLTQLDIGRFVVQVPASTWPGTKT